MSATMIGAGRYGGQKGIVSDNVSPSPAFADFTMVTAGTDQMGD